jgi:hypothetical protein
MLSSAAGNEQSVENLGHLSFLLHRVRPLRVSRTSQPGIPGSARCGHDKTEQESTGGSPPSGRKKPEMSSLVLFTPRINSQYKNPSGDETYMENQSWNCAFI